MSDLIDDPILERLLDRTFDACRQLLKDGPLEEAVAIQSISEQTHLDAGSVSSALTRLASQGIILYREGRYDITR